MNDTNVTFSLDNWHQKCITHHSNRAFDPEIETKQLNQTN